MARERITRINNLSFVICTESSLWEWTRKRPRESVQLSLSTTVASSHMISQPTIHTHRLVSAKQLYWVAQSAAAQIQILVEVDLAQLTYKDI